MSRKPIQRTRVHPSDGPLWRGAYAGPVALAVGTGARPPVESGQAPGSIVLSDRTLERWKLREALRPVQPWPRQRQCGWIALGPVEIGPGWVIGLAQCGSVHSCPVCSARIRSDRATEVSSLVADWKASDPERGAGLLTLTVRHRWGMVLGELRRGLSRAWGRLWQGSVGSELRRAFCHLVRAIDTTHGSAGWHPHLHVLCFYDRQVPEGWRERVAERWADSVAAELGELARPLEHGIHWQDPVRSDYLLKLGLELAGGKKAPKVSGPMRADPWEIARRSAKEWKRWKGDVSRTVWVPLWRDYARAMRGARALTWSAGTHRLAEQSVERQEIPEQTGAPWVVAVSAPDWRRTMTHSGVRGTLPELLTITTEGPDKTIRFLEQQGCKAHALHCHEQATLLTTTGGIFDETNAFARRRWLAESMRRNELAEQASDRTDRVADARPRPGA